VFTCSLLTPLVGGAMADATQPLNVERLVVVGVVTLDWTRSAALRTGLRPYQSAGPDGVGDREVCAALLSGVLEVIETPRIDTPPMGLRPFNTHLGVLAAPLLALLVGVSLTPLASVLGLAVLAP
jgi:hypothetical protein